MAKHHSTDEQRRIDAQNAGRETCPEWGAYLSERQWGTVREDYSDPAWPASATANSSFAWGWRYGTARTLF